jgi:hypothetical protein
MLVHMGAGERSVQQVAGFSYDRGKEMMDSDLLVASELLFIHGQRVQYEEFSAWVRWAICICEV